jgi:hypothetical protein
LNPAYCHGTKPLLKTSKEYAMSFFKNARLRNSLIGACVAFGVAAEGFELSKIMHNTDELSLAIVDKYVLPYSPSLRDERLLMAYSVSEYVRSENLAVCDRALGFIDRCDMKPETAATLGRYLGDMQRMLLQAKQNPEGRPGFRL